MVTDIHFEGGCPGNLKAISKLLEGSTIEHVESLLLGNTCLNKTTSCTDQLAIALQKARDGQLEALPQA